MGRKQSKTQRRPVLFWVAPVLAVVLTPLYLHAAVHDLSSASDDHMLTAIALVIVLVTLSILGCVMDRAFECQPEFPVLLLLMQMALGIGVIFLWPSWRGSKQAPVAGTPSDTYARFLSAGSASLPKQGGAKMLETASLAQGVSAGSIAVAAKPDDQGQLASLDKLPAAQAVNPAAKPASVPGLSGWSDAGVGYCEDSETRQEFSSLHAVGKTLQECARLGLKDLESIAFDFAPSKGACDIRFPSGAIAQSVPGYTYWGWGAGNAKPFGFGKQKHEVETHCYAKIVEATTPPPMPVFQPLLPGDSESLLARGKDRFSVVLACASEGNFMVKTVQSFCDRTPANVLHEIIVVDDGSEPPLEGMLSSIDRVRCGLKVMRHSSTLGLMIAKQTGGDAATGEYIGFFDCHVSPNKIWHRELLDVLKKGPRRMAVPTITDLDLDTWEEKTSSQLNSKCYIDFNAQFMWFDDSSDYIPVISGGLVALSRAWWMESGGFDNKMRGWGGENVDQSLRTWLCGGEIIRAKSSRIAHMWRVTTDSRTSSHYKRVNYGVNNIARVATAWFDKFLIKYNDGAVAQQVAKGQGPDVSNFLKVKETLGCKPFAYFLHRFRKVYRDGGMLPTLVFKLRSARTQMCVHRTADTFGMTSCTEASWFHLANQNTKKGNKCCSGIRQWNAMECFDRLDATGPLAYWCDVAGANENQQYLWGEDNMIRHPLTSNCLSVSPTNNQQMEAVPCERSARWEQIEGFLPEETTMYEAEVQRLGLSASMPDN